MRLKKILCPVDFSECSHEALLRAVELAKESSAELSLVHAYQLPVYDGTLYVPDMYAEVQKFAEDSVAAWVREAEKLGAANVKGAAVMGVAWDEIVRRARDEKSDLIVIGTHGRSGLKHVLIGSVAERVVRHAPCAVLVVRDAGKTGP